MDDLLDPAGLGRQNLGWVETAPQNAGDPFDLVLLAAKEMADARHHDFARIHVDWGCHVELAHWRSTHSRADVQAVFAVPDVGDRKSTRLNPVTNAPLVCRLLLE